MRHCPSCVAGQCSIIHSSRSRFVAGLNSGVGRAMKSVCLLSIVLLGATSSLCSAMERLSACPTTTAPTVTVAPKLPPRLHNEFFGIAVVAFVVTASGQVQSPTIVSAKWQPIGRSRGQPVGYNEAILSAVAQWRYPRMAHSCRHQIPVEFKKWTGLLAPRLVRPNNSFKPNPHQGAARLNTGVRGSVNRIAAS